MQRDRRLHQEQGQIDRHGDAEQCQKQGHHRALLGEGAVPELVAVQFASQAHKTPCGKEIHEYTDRDKRDTKLE
jgi:hypothetical protein